MLVLIGLSFSSVQGQNLFADLNGRSRQWIEHNYPDFKINPSFGESFDGFYKIDQMRCQDGGYIILMVGFDGYQRPDEVGTVSLYAKGCSEIVPDDDFAGWVAVFIEMFGLTGSIDKAEVMMNKPGNVMIMFPDLITFTAHMRYNSKSNFYYFYSSCEQIYPSKK